MFAFPGHAGVALLIAGLTGLNPWLLIIGAMIPDLDTIPYLFGVPYRRTHRTITHSAFMPLLSLFISPVIALGVLSHLIVDLITFPGVKLFYPFSDKEYYFYHGRFKKYHNPLLFINDSLRKPSRVILEVAVFLIGLFSIKTFL